VGKNIGTSSSGFIRHYFTEYIPKIHPVKNKGTPTKQAALKRWAYLTPPAPHRTLSPPSGILSGCLRS